MNITATREEICDMLDVTNNNLKYIIKNNKLSHRLELKGYKLEAQYKVGRNTVYELSKIDINEFKVIQNKHKIIKKKENEIYAKCRLLLEDGMKMSKRQIIRDNNINIDEHTAKRYDDMLIDEMAMKEDKMVYYRKDQEGNIEEVTFEYYNNYWLEQAEAKKLISHMRKEVIDGKMSMDAYDVMSSNVYSSLERSKGYVVYKFMSYKEAENTKKICNMLNSL